MHLINHRRLYRRRPPEAQKKKLHEIRACIRKSAPGAAETLKWSMPAFSYRRILVLFAAHKNHIGFSIAFWSLDLVL